MTTINHQQAAIQAGAKALAGDWGPVLTAMFSDYSATAIAAAAPHLRAEWEQELARAVKRLPWNGVTHGGTMVPLDAVLALLEGGGEWGRRNRV